MIGKANKHVPHWRLACLFFSLLPGLALFSVAQAQVKVTAYYDANHNGVKEANEPAVPGLTVTIAASDSNAAAPTALQVRVVKTYDVVVVKENSAKGSGPKVAAEALLPKNLELHQNFPNPFNPVTMIRYDLPGELQVSLQIWSALGQKVRTLVDCQQKAGVYTVSFEARGLPSGIYFAKLVTGDYTQIRRLVLTK